MIKNYKFTIYQVKSVENCPYSFMSYNFAKKNNFNLNDYNEITTGQYEKDEIEQIRILDTIYRDFNRVTEEDVERLKDFKGHSLSVSDIVKLVDTDNSEETYFYCNPFGWTVIDL